MLDKGHKKVSLKRQCELLALSRSTAYYVKRIPLLDWDHVITLLQECYDKDPTYGIRRRQVWLRKEHGLWVNRKTIAKLIHLTGLYTLVPRKKRYLSEPDRQNAVYPYLLEGLEITHPNQVWVSDITYVRMAHGFAYLVAVMDLYSRAVLSWRLSNSLDTSFCLEALEEAVAAYGAPEIFNTDQGAQYTSAAFTDELKKHHIQISMTGKGRCIDNVYVERLWWTAKYEHIFLMGYETMKETRAGLRKWFAYYNNRRYHQALNYEPPMAVYCQGMDCQVEKAMELVG